MKKFGKIHGRAINAISADALEAMRSYRWPGNIRELENVVERAFIVENSDQITMRALPENISKASHDNQTSHSRHHPQQALPSVNQSGPLDFEVYKEQAEKEFIISALKANHGRINKTVALANIPKNTLLRKIRKYGINVKDYL